MLFCPPTYLDIGCDLQTSNSTSWRLLTSLRLMTAMRDLRPRTTFLSRDKDNRSSPPSVGREVRSKSAEETSEPVFSMMRPGCDWYQYWSAHTCSVVVVSVHVWHSVPQSQQSHVSASGKTVTTQMCFLSLLSILEIFWSVSKILIFIPHISHLPAPGRGDLTTQTVTDTVCSHQRPQEGIIDYIQ